MKINLNRVIILSFIMLFVSLTLASSKTLNMSVNLAQFNRQDKETLVEFYYSIPDTSLKFIYGENGNYSAEASMQIQFLQDGKVIKTDSWRMPVTVKDYTGKLSQLFYGQRNIYILPGKYNVKFSVSDLKDTESKANLDFDYTVVEYKNDKIEFSSIETATIIELKEDTEREWDKAFDKFIYYVIPNPSAEYNNIGGSILFYYEVYNAKTFAPDGYLLTSRVYSSARKLELEQKFKNKSLADGIIQGTQVAIDNLPTGVYYLDLTIKYPQKNPTDSVTTSIKFYYYNSNIPFPTKPLFIENLTFEKSEFATMIGERLEDEINKSMVIATKREHKQLEVLDTDQAKQRFLFSFWLAKDMDTNTVANEALIGFRQRVKYADEHFKWGQFQGWKSDRGKVLLTFGFPTDTKYKNTVSYLKAYEEWIYDNLGGGAAFYFVDTGGYGNYKYVHSTYPGEIYNPNWYDRFVRASSGDLDDIFNGE